MNNIEILEEFIKYFEAEATQRKYRRNISITVGEDDIEAIENLIQENKELKEENKIAKKMGAEIMADFIKRDVIPKSKLKEKIEELKGRKMDIVTSQVYNVDEKLKILEKDKIREAILQELLEEGE